MSNAYWPKSSTEKRLKSIAKRLGGKISVDFSGIVVGDKNILYRHTNGYYQKTRGKKYGRWSWNVPFGREADWHKVDFVLLHGSPFGAIEEAFLLFTVRKAVHFGRAWPGYINISAEPMRAPHGNRDKIWKHQLSLAEVRRTLAR